MSALRTALVPAVTSRRAVVGIAGAPGCGKSTVAADLVAELDADGLPAVVLPMDGFHLPQPRLVELGRRERMGAADTFDVTGFAALLVDVRDATRTVRAPLFDRTVEEPVADALVIAPEVRVVVVEGNYLLDEDDGWAAIRPLLDRVAFVRVDPRLRRERLLARHVEFGKTPDEAEAWVAAVDDPNAVRIERGAGRADVVLEPDARPHP